MICSGLARRTSSALMRAGAPLWAPGLSCLLLGQAQQPPAAPPPQPLPHPALPEPGLVTLGPPWWVYAGAGLVFCALLWLVLWLMFRPKKAAPVAGPKPWKRAMESMRAIRNHADIQPTSDTAHQVSETLRRYFMDRYKIPAPFRTRRELFEGASPAASQKLQRYAPLADLWDQLSFAPIPANGAEAMALVDKAIAHLEEDKP